MDGLRDAPSLPRLEILAWCFAIYLSLHLSLPNLPPYLPVFRVQILIQFAHQRKKRKKKKTNTLSWKHRCGPLPGKRHFFLLFSGYVFVTTLLFFFFPRENGLLPPGWILRRVSLPPRWPAWPVNRVLTPKHSGRVFLGRLQLKPQLVDTS